MRIYTLLGIQPTATEAEIKKAYRKLAIQYHPDKNAGNLDAEQKFIEINKAYKLALKNVGLIKRSDIHKTPKSYSTTQQEYKAQEYTSTYRRAYSTPPKDKKEEFDWDKVYNKYSNHWTNEKVQKEKAKESKSGNVEVETEPIKKTIVVEENFDLSRSLLYVVCGLIGLLVYTISGNTLWGISSAFLGISAIIITKLLKTEPSN